MVTSYLKLLSETRTCSRYLAIVRCRLGLFIPPIFNRFAVSPICRNCTKSFIQSRNTLNCRRQCTKEFTWVWFPL